MSGTGSANSGPMLSDATTRNPVAHTIEAEKIGGRLMIS
jgi:hypothetical protein